jgi:histidinol-phosphate aminotransferase
MTRLQSILNLATPAVQGLKPYQPGKPTSELQRELGLEHIIKLASNENPLGPSAKAISAIQSAIPELSRYPDGNGFGLKRSLADKYEIYPEQVTLGNGSNEILELVARAFLDVNSEVIFSQHAFAVYPLVTQALGAKSCVVPAVDYGHDLQAMLARVNNNTCLVFIANPNNPTGTYLSDDELKNFLVQLPENIICVLDEAYYEYVVEKDYPDSVKWLQSHSNLLITRTFSKAYGLAGLRVGYSLSSPEMADILNRVRQPFNNNALALAAAETALHDQEYIQQSVALNNRGMKQLTDAFKHLDLQWIPSAGNFVSVDLQQPGMPIYEALLHKGVIVRPVSNYEMPNHLRISIGTADENHLFINALGEVMADV